MGESVLSERDIWKVTIPTTRFGFPDQDSADVAYVQAILELSFG